MRSLTVLGAIFVLLFVTARTSGTTTGAIAEAAQDSAQVSVIEAVHADPDNFGGV